MGRTLEPSGLFPSKLVGLVRRTFSPADYVNFYTGHATKWVGGWTEGEGEVCICISIFRSQRVCEYASA
jgi:hypothetical protein